MNIDTNILKKIRANWFQQYIKRVIYNDYVQLIPWVQGLFSICKSVWYNTLTNWRIKTIWSSQEMHKKNFDITEQPFIIKALQKLGIEGKYLNIIKAQSDKPTVNIILKGKKLNLFYSNIRNKTKTPTFNIVF